MSKKLEYSVCVAISNYIKLQYPKALFRFDQAGYNLSIAQAGMNKSIQLPNFKYPDLFIAKQNKRYAGMYLEIKKDGENLYKKDGYTFKTDHLLGQYLAMGKLIDAGYFASFAIGFDQAKLLIDKYMGIE